MLAATILTAALLTPACSWDKPGANRYTGNVPASVQHYLDVPMDTRNKLQKRLETHQYDDVADIKRDSIRGKYEYSNLRDMHFGKNQICQTISRDKWTDSATERGLIYCEDGYCLIVPTVCGNISRITRITTPAAPAAPSGGAGGGGRAPYAYVFPPIAPLQLPAPPTFETVVNSDILPPSLVKEEPYWFPVIPPIGSIGGDSGCCYRPIIKPPIPAVPEPSSFYLLIMGLITLIAIRFKTRQ